MDPDPTKLEQFLDDDDDDVQESNGNNSSEITIAIDEVEEISSTTDNEEKDVSDTEGAIVSAKDQRTDHPLLKKSHLWEYVTNVASSPIGTQITQGMRLRKISAVNPHPRRNSEDGVPKSSKHIHQMRKKVSVTSQDGKKKSNQQDLALAIIEGNLPKVEEIVDAYTSLYGSNGFDLILNYRYNINPKTFSIAMAQDQPVSGSSISLGEQLDMFQGLSCLHIACAFDQEQILAYFIRYGSSVLKLVTPSQQSLLHTCCWFGTLAPLTMVIQYGGNVNLVNALRHTALHLAVLKGHHPCVKALIKSGASLECQDEGGNTPLHAAVLAGSYDCAQELIHYDVDVNKTNCDNGTPIHYASSVPLVTLLMNNGADPNICLFEGDSKGMTVFNLLLEKMPEGCNEILSKYLTSNGKSLGAIDLEVKYDFDLFYQEYLRNPEEGEIGILRNVAQADQRDILKHPVNESFLHMKWLLLKNYFRFYVLAYCLFLFTFTALVFMQFSPVMASMDPEFRSTASFVCLIISYVAVCILIIKNMYLLVYNFRLYAQTLQNFVEVVMIALCGVFLAFYHAMGATDVAVHLSALSLFASWFNFTLLIGKLPFAGIYINMIAGITKDLLKFLFLYTSTIVAFGLCFHILGHHHEHFEDPLSSILCMLAMMVGEFNFGDIFLNSKIRYPITTQIMFVLFLLLVSIIIMNLLVGLAISNITAQFQSAGVYRLKMTVLLIQMIEDVLSLVSKILPCCFKDSGLFNHLQAKQRTDVEAPSKLRDTCVYIYPNQSKSTIYVLDGKGRKRPVGFDLPPWILANTFKILAREHESTASSLQATSDRRRQDDRLVRLTQDVKLMKRELSIIRGEIQSLASLIRGGRRSPLIK
ncbi:hypothetical protein TCAL_02177 [Tigriopus californicus]|uniref:Ion transport domain-containing protein n=1 Tax=Tigriopus californicus TaxID=6832 RepID=A0A553N743_TIGCA|nr:hypothetical protein TCAL_02177 [Tigriopus californicus]|eukprot:TCALIF_02177-PA protein Name:"Similar to pyx Transient receptor potential channel pyrexia (Drosophila melanogaster)" AED:0.17 eAED:0.17 QI:0/-1/0/1/-1/1/1/0/868